MMESTAFLRRGIVPTLPLPAASGIPLSFRRNVSYSNGLFAEKVNENIYKSNNNGRCSEITCFRINRSSSSSSSRSGGFPSANSKAALQSLLCFSFNTPPPEDHTKLIASHKKKALQTLLAEKPAEAERIMRNVYNKYHRASFGQIKYDATLALIEILIHLGTDKSLGDAIGHLNDLERITDCLPSDAKLSLYRAIIYTLLEENKEAQNYWNSYTATIGSGPPRR